MLSDEQEKSYRLMLLDKLAEDERERIEEVLFLNPEHMEKLEALEEELILDYLQGRLAAPEHADFELAYQRSSRRWARVESTRALLTTVGPHTLALPAPSPVANETPSWSGWLGQLWLVFAAVTVALAGAVYYWSVKPTGQFTTQTEIVARLHLPLGRVRGVEAALVPILRLEATGGTVVLELDLPPEVQDQSPSAKLGLAGPAIELWNGKARRISNRLATVEIPARLLLRGDYVLRLEQKEQVAATYQFRVD